MKVVAHHNIFDTEIIIAEIPESEDRLMKESKSKDIDIDDLSLIKSASRRKEKMAIRLLVADYFGMSDAIIYSKSGAPALKNHNELFISITHSGKYASIAISRKAPIGIDIETIVPRVLRIREKFLSNHELNVIDSNSIRDNLIAWTSKEALFKIIPESEIDFREHLHLKFCSSDIKSNDNRNKLIHFATETRTPNIGNFIISSIIENDYIFSIVTYENHK